MLPSRLPHRMFRLACLLALCFAFQVTGASAGDSPHMFWPESHTPGALAEQPVVLSPSHPFTPLESYFSVLMDATGELDIHAVASADHADRFMPATDMRQPDGTGTSYYWLRFSLVNTSDSADSTAWFLGLKVFYKQLDVYMPEPDGSGWKKLQFPQSPGGFPPMSVLPLPNYAQGRPQAVYARMLTSSDQFPSLAILTSAAHLGLFSRMSLLVGLFFGIMGITVLLHVFLLVTHRDKSSFWYLCTLVSLNAFFLSDDSLLFGTFFDLPAFWNALLPTIILSFALVFSSLFARSFLHTRGNSKIADRMLRSYLAFSILLVPMVLQPNLILREGYLDFLGLAAGPIFMGAGVIRLWQGFKPARLFLLAVSFYPLGAAIEILSDFGFLPQNELTDNGFQIGTLVMVVMLALAAMDRIRQLKKTAEKAEAAMRESELKLRAIFDQTFQFISLLRADGEVLDINTTAAQSIHADRADILGKRFWDPLLWSRCEHLRERIRQAVVDAASGQFVRFEITNVESDGSPRHLDLSLKPVPDGTKDVAFIIAEGRDITELKRTQQHMFQADKLSALGRIAAGVAHEINNPNNFIYFNLPVLREYLDAMRDTIDASAATRDDLTLMGMPHDRFLQDVYQLLADMEHGSFRITNIVKDLRNYIRSHEEDGKVPADLGDVIEHAMSLVGKQVQKTVSHLDVDVPDDLPKVVMHTGHIEQVLINLLVNAGHAASKEDGRIRILAGREGENHVFVQVQDNGPGVPDEIADRIFEPFFTTKSSETGTGQGLAISRSIAEDHGGTLTCEGREGVGAHFTLTLPIRQ